MEVSPRHKQVSRATVIDHLRAQIVTRATNSGLNNPHEIAANGDMAIQHANWLSDAFANLNREDRLWAESIRTSSLWREWGPTGETRDVPFTRLLAMGVWDWNDEEKRGLESTRAMHHLAAIGARLMLRALEEEKKVSLWQGSSLAMILTTLDPSAITWNESSASSEGCGMPSLIGSMLTAPS